METIRNTPIRIVDYTAICSCGWEHYSPLLKWIKEDSRGHLKDHNKNGVVIIDRNVDETIDDTFKSIRIKK